ncbi:complement decay-accelerating factor-like [Mixophyes fleayi]|uniref:complement decay-accelerating factor-like n=1 Tax=Mixophyes fleayi TaxID=3061075 RepID=UPI003F4E0822
MWDPTLPTCNRSCTAPPRLTFGQLTNEFIDKKYLFVNSTVTYTCQPGYVRDSAINNTITCLRDSTWSIPGEFCKLQECPSPIAITDGSFNPDKTDYVYQDAVTYTCKSGLSLIGEASIFCTSHGNWSSHAPQCKGEVC